MLEQIPELAFSAPEIQIEEEELINHLECWFHKNHFMLNICSSRATQSSLSMLIRHCCWS